MASPPTLDDFEILLAPIAGAKPAGEPLPFTVRKKLDDARKEVNLNQFAANDPRRPEPGPAVDWKGIEKLTKDTLANSSKDFLLAARLTEALVKRNGFGGLRDGLRLLRRLAQECWDRIYPVIEDGDVEARAAVFAWLDDEFKGALFPNTLRTVPLTQVEEQKFGWQNWKDAQDARARQKPSPVTVEAFEQAAADTPREYCQTVVDDIAESAVELTALSEVLNAKMGESAPGLTQVRKALLECQELAQQILKRKGAAPVSAPEVAASTNESVAVAPAASSAARRPLTREDLLARLAEASEMLLQLEPQSAIAYMIQRAVKLARLPLPELMRVLIRDTAVLGQLDRDLDLGFEKQEAAKPVKK